MCDSSITNVNEKMTMATAMMMTTTTTTQYRSDPPAQSSTSAEARKRNLLLDLIGDNDRPTIHRQLDISYMHRPCAQGLVSLGSAVSRISWLFIEALDSVTLHVFWLVASLGSCLVSWLLVASWDVDQLLETTIMTVRYLRWRRYQLDDNEMNMHLTFIYFR
jgi:hypothetical protein